MPKEQWICSGLLLDVSHARLGRLITSILSPWQDYYDPNVPTETTLPHTVRDFTDSRSKGRRRGVSVSFTQFFSIRRFRSKSNTATIEAPKCTSRFLPNSMEYFSRCCKNPETQQWLGEMMQRRIPIYLIVGVKVVHGAKVEVFKSEERGSSGKCLVPVGRALSGGLDGGVLDCEVELGVEKDHEVGTSYFFEDDKVYAVQYRKIEFGSFANKSVGKARLQSENVWKTYIGTRGMRKTEVLIEARLGDQAGAYALEKLCRKIVLASSEELLLVDGVPPPTAPSAKGSNAYPVLRPIAVS